MPLSNILARVQPVSYTHLDPEAVKAAAELINGAERPLVLVGQGVELGNAQQELRAFIEKADMPAGCTLLGLSALPTEHPLNKGMLGMHGNLGPNMNTNKCDVLIAVGMRFDDRVTGNLATYAKQAKVIHFDIDPAEINKNVHADVAAVSYTHLDGPDGPEGDKGQNGTAPVVTMKMDTDGHLYWAIKNADGTSSFLLDNNGQKVRTSGTDGIVQMCIRDRYKRTDLLKAFLCTSKCKILVHFCFFIIYINL